jgi:NAD+ synthase (glutamine-hydrolysing)
MVFAGHNLIAENGVLLAERRFACGLTISEIDTDRLAAERRRMTTFPDGPEKDLYAVGFTLEPATTTLTRVISPTPFVPEDAADRKARCDEILLIAAMGLKTRLEHTHASTAVVGLSGGLDSTLAVLITALAMKMLDRPATDVIAVTMPAFGIHRPHP